MNWFETFAALIKRAEPLILVTVAAVRGSSPRAPGTVMIVTANSVYGTIGGGELEYVAIAHSRSLLGPQADEPAGLRQFDLGPAGPDAADPKFDSTCLSAESLARLPGERQKLAQCCGGSVILHFERVTGCEPNWRSLVDNAGLIAGDSVLVSFYSDAPTTSLPLASNWLLPGSTQNLSPESLDPRLQTIVGRPAAWKECLRDSDGCAMHSTASTNYSLSRPLRAPGLSLMLFGAGHVGREVVRVLAPLCHHLIWHDSRAAEFPALIPDGVQCSSDDPDELIAQASNDVCFLVMTHSHALDMAICEAVLRRDQFAWLGLIGSRAKRLRFERVMRTLDIDPDRLARLVCPIGVEGIQDKQPAAIAIAVAAQLLQTPPA